MSVSLQRRARTQLGLSDKYPDSLLAKTYLKELEAHLARYPFDYNFSLVKQIRKGYGILTCCEDGCGTEIDLTPLPHVRDGGRSTGVGSLSAFQKHIETHPTHKKNCLRRVAKEVDQAIELPTPEAARASGTVTVPTKNAPRRVSEQQPFTVSLTPSNTIRKRHLDSAFKSQVLEEHVPVLKQVKQEPQPFEMPESPLTTKFDLVTVTADRKPAPTPSMDAEERRHGVKRPADTEAHHDRFTRKGRFSAADVMRVGRVKAELDDIRREGDQSIAAPLKKELATGASSMSGTFLPAPDLDQDIKPRLQATASRPFPLPALIAAPLTTNNVPRTALPPCIAPEHTSSQPLSISRTAYNNVPDQPVLPNHPFLPATTSPAQQIAGNYRKPCVPQQQPNAVAGPSRNPAPSSTGNPFLNVRVKMEGQGTDFEPSPLVHPSTNAAPLEAEPVKDAFDPVPTPVASCSTAPMAVAAHKLPAPFHRPGGMDLDSSDDEDYDTDARLEILANMTADDMIDLIGINVPPPTVDERDDDGLYYGRGRDLYIGPQAQVGDLNQFLILAGNAEQFDSSASIGDALEKLGLQHLTDPLPGMTVSLMAHQAIGVAWMVDKEKGHLKGGCLADEMGLGKTIQMLAAMSMNPSTDPALKATLIVTPLGLLDQWKLEIETKTNSDLKVLIYHGPNRPRRKEDLLKYDIVLTTFSTMANEWPDYEKQAKEAAKARKNRKTDSFIVHDDDEGYLDKVPRRKQESGLLFQVEFWRIVLDEAQNIRNRTTRASRAAGELRANHRWCLTGTPIINSLTDVYGYVRFLKIRPWYDWQHFNDQIARKEKKNPKLAVSRLQAVIATFQIRRTKESMLDGKRLIELPLRQVSMTQLEFSEEERQIYRMVEARSQAIFNRYLRQGTVLKHYHQVLVLLLRLRQVCSHPCLIQEEVVAFVPKDQVDDTVPEPVTEVTRARKLVSPEFVEAMQRHFKEKLAQRMEAEKQSADAALEDEDCPICFEIMSDTAVFTACKHVFCRECIVGYLDTPLVNKNNDNGDDHPCPKCRAPVARNMLFSRAAFEPNDETSDDESDEVEGSDMDVDEPTTLKGKGKARPSRSRRKKAQYDGDDDDDDMSDFIVEDDEDEEKKDARRARKKRLGKRRSNVIIDSDDEVDTPEEQEVLIGKKTREELEKAELGNMSRFLPSTKMKYMMTLLEKSFEKKPDEKILIVSQWTSCLTLVSDYLSEKGVIHVKYQGDMNREKRDQTVRAFMSKDKARVMLMSLKCGGVGLNLTRANNVICLDLAWSLAVESQAWDRVHRLGQSRPVNIQRLVIENTVEDRILRLQERKQLLADGSLGEGTGKKLGRLTVGELANLFGLDHRGNLLHGNQNN